MDRYPLTATHAPWTCAGRRWVAGEEAYFPGGFLKPMSLEFSAGFSRAQGTHFSVDHP